MGGVVCVTGASKPPPRASPRLVSRPSLKNSARRETEAKKHRPGISRPVPKPSPYAVPSVAPFSDSRDLLCPSLPFW